ncbi:fungal fucose-specific lectin [Aspergillus lentulus]|uniref:Fucose-specific lectin n=1 Tax=Aspergillus lentulus TaxID=293939 RepID=A0ABQ1A1Q3_ASPLE|nr:fungal fucose-specific lectin [Aspergillus lentulus]
MNSRGRALNNNDFQVAANSTVGAAYLAETQLSESMLSRPIIQSKDTDGMPNLAISFSVPNANPGTALAVTTTEVDNIHVYYGVSGNSIPKKVHDSNSGWYDGAFSQSGMPGSQAAAINWRTGSALNIRVYF